MEELGLTILHNPANVDRAFVQTSYTIVTEFLKENYSYIFKAGDGVVCNYTIATWSSKIKRSDVIKGVLLKIDCICHPARYIINHTDRSKPSLYCEVWCVIELRLVHRSKMFSRWQESSKMLLGRELHDACA